MKILIEIIAFAVIVNVSNAFCQTSKLVLSSRSFHPNSVNDTLNTIKVIDQIHPARLDWIYCESPSITKMFKDRNLPFSLAIHPELADSSGYTTKKHRIVDIDGRPYVAPWMKNTTAANPYWGCVNDPDFQDLFLKKSFRFIDLGAYAIFVDDPIFNVQLQLDRPNKYGCFCDYCISGFKEYISTKGYTFNNAVKLKQKLRLVLNNKGTVNSADSLLDLYQKYQMESVIVFLKTWKQKLRAYKPDIKILDNNYNGSWNAITEIFDGGICELSKNNLNINYLDSIYKVADRLNKTQVFSLVSNDQNPHNYLMAYCFMRGRDYLIPWDVYTPTKENPINRFYTNLNNLKTEADHFNTGKILIKVDNTINGKDLYKTKNESGKKIYLLNVFPLASSLGQ